MSADPWAVTSPSAGVYRFTNNTDKPAAAIFFTPRGVELKTGEPGNNSVSQRIEPGKHFEIKMKRLPGAADPAGVQMEWRIPLGDGNFGMGVWGYAISD
ncbi:hypothetical protein [Nocardia sp. SC052]|uniref:hypothetical protein n=1 Tax=Nocardia sichangensis TaxID=3385975 RepID=UPI0039A2EA58